MNAAPSLSSSSPLPWTWIFEHLVGQKEVGTPILREMLLTLPDSALSVSLQRRLALRYLEEAISAEKIDGFIIPLIVTLLEHTQRASISSFPTSLDYSCLLMRVKIEAVLMYIRANPREWCKFSQALELLFPENTENAEYRGKRKQLLRLSKFDDEKKIMEVLEEYSVSALRCDILKCIISEKHRLEETFLDKLWQDVHSGKCPLTVGLSGKERDENREDFHSVDMPRNSIRNGDQTDIEAIKTRHDESIARELDKSCSREMGRDSAEKSPSNRISGTDLKGKSKLVDQASRPAQTPKIQLRQRNQYGKAIIPSSPSKDVKNLRAPVNSKDTADSKVVAESAQILKIGDDGQEEYCHKCKKGGSLVCCEGCPIAVHKRCMGSDSSIVSGEWVCPLCIEKKAAEAVAKAKEEQFAAKEKVAQFLAELNTRQAEKSTSGRNSDDHGQQAHGENMKKTLARKKDDRQGDSLNTDINKEMKTIPNSFEAAVCIYTDTPEEIESRSKECHDITNHHPSPGKRSRDLTRDDVTCAVLNNVDGTSSKAVDDLQGHAVQSTVPQGVDGDGHDGDIEEDNGERDSEFRNVNRKQKLKMRTNRLIPGLRRKRLRWTKEEEDALKEGVKKFSHDGTWGFQWTRILDFGRGKLHPSRTDIDLKDKWRNLKDKTIK